MHRPLISANAVSNAASLSIGAGSGTDQCSRVGIDIAAKSPKILTDEAVRQSDVVITMGCGEACPFYPSKRYEDWVLDDPAGKGVEAVRPIRDEIRRRVERLIDQLAISADNASRVSGTSR